jgi:hypothetical protein
MNDTARIQYSKFENGEVCFVIAEQQSGGGWVFWSQEIGEVRWHRFTPSAAESQAALALAGSGSAQGWPRLVFVAGTGSRAAPAP